MLDDFELADIAVVFTQALGCPGRHDGLHIANRDAVFFFKNLPVLFGVE